MNTKEMLTAFYQEFFNDHVVASAEKYVREDYIQHNPTVPQGRAALMSAFEERFRVDPTFHVEILRIVQEGDYVAVHLKNVDPEGRVRAMVADFYRIQDGMLAEHWDVLQYLK